MVGTSIEFDRVLDLCQHKHRRTVLAALSDQRQSLTMNDLAEMIVEHHHHTPLTEVDDETITQIQISLHHVHLPRFEEAGLIEYSPERQLVESTGEFNRVEPHLSAILDADSVLATPLEA